MSKQRIVAGIDIGSSKVTTIIATLGEEDLVSIIGVSSIPSKGVKKGVIVDIDEAVESILSSLEGAERMAGYAISSAFVSVDGTHIASQNSHGVVAVHNSDGEISDTDIERVTEAARAITLPTSREIIHVLPQGFIVDGQDGVKDPAGMSGIRLEIKTNIITGSTTVIKNLLKCISQVAIEVEDLVYSGLASAEAVMTETDRELGCCLLDIGSGTTKFMVYTDGHPSFASVLPVGGQHVTNDIAVALGTNLETAEIIKTNFAQLIERSNNEVFSTSTAHFGIENSTGIKRPATKETAKKVKEIDISHLNLDIKKFSLPLIERVIAARLDDIFRYVNSELVKEGFTKKLPSGIILTGGGSLTPGAVEIARAITKGAVKIGVPHSITGLVDELGSPAYSTPVGLIKYAQKVLPQTPSRLPMTNSKSLGAFLKKTVSVLKSLRVK